MDFTSRSIGISHTVGTQELNNGKLVCFPVAATGTITVIDAANELVQTTFSVTGAPGRFCLTSFTYGDLAVGVTSSRYLHVVNCGGVVPTYSRIDLGSTFDIASSTASRRAVAVDWPLAYVVNDSASHRPLIEIIDLSSWTHLDSIGPARPNYYWSCFVKSGYLFTVDNRTNQFLRIDLSTGAISAAAGIAATTGVLAPTGRYLAPGFSTPGLGALDLDTFAAQSHPIAGLHSASCVRHDGRIMLLGTNNVSVWDETSNLFLPGTVSPSITGSHRLLHRYGSNKYFAGVENAWRVDVIEESPHTPPRNRGFRHSGTAVVRGSSG